MRTRILFIALTAIVLGSQMTLSAQEKKKANKQHFRAMQCNQIVSALALDDATAAKFVPVYENYLNDMRATHGMSAGKKAVKPVAKGGTAPAVKPAVKPMPTDAEVEQAIKNRFAQSRKMLDVREKYYNEFRKVLSPKQIMRVYQLEKKNAQHFQKELKKRHGQKSGQHKQEQRNGHRHVQHAQDKK